MVEKTFRELFTLASKDVTKWFPRHMYSGMKQMQAKLKNIDLIIEMHDARIPFSGRNPMFSDYLIKVRPHILVLNKIDLADLSLKKEIEEQLKKENVERILFTNCKRQQDSGIKQIMPIFQSIIEQSKDSYNYRNRDLCMMVIGVPNVGKSSFINALRARHTEKGKAAHVGAIPGITRSVQERILVCEHPRVFLLDTPGILSPNVKNIDVGLKLAVCGTIKDDLLGEDVTADYLLFWMNKNKRFSYVKFLGLKEPSDNITEVLIQTAINLGKTIKHKTFEGPVIVRPDVNAAAFHFLRAFREGKLGKTMFDEDILQNKSDIK